MKIIKFTLAGFRFYGPSISISHALRGSSVGCAPAWYADCRGIDSHVQQHSFVEIGHEIISTDILSFAADSRRSVVSYWRKNVH